MFTIGAVISYLVIIGDQMYFGISYFVKDLELDESLQWLRGIELVDRRNGHRTYVYSLSRCVDLHLPSNVV